MSTTSLAEPRPASPIRRLVAQHPLPAFFIMAFVFSWLAVLPLVLSRSGFAFLPPDLPVEPFQILGAFAGPTLSAYIVTAAQSGWPGVRKLLARYVQWRVGLQWYLLVLAGPLVVLTLGAIPFLGVSILGAFLQNLPLALSFYLPLLLVGVILGPLWEEPGWRGFALPRLQQQYGPLAGTAILGVLWGLWHLPGFFGGWLGALSLSSLSASLLGIMAFAFILTWVYNHTRGSLLIMILLHSAFNAASAFGGQILPAEMPETVRALVYSGWIPAATYTVCAALILLFTEGSLSYHPEAN